LRLAPYDARSYASPSPFIGKALTGELISLSGPDRSDHIVQFRHRDAGLIDRDWRFQQLADDVQKVSHN
jgi:hypothetical protein